MENYEEQDHRPRYYSPFSVAEGAEQLFQEGDVTGMLIHLLVWAAVAAMGFVTLNGFVMQLAG